jgi:hypothetical protein
VLLVPPVFYGIEANESEILAGLYQTLDFIAGNSTEILRFNDYEFLPGMVHTFVLIGLPSGEPAIEALEFTDFGRGAPTQRFYVGTISTAQSVPARVRAGPSTAASIVTLLDSGSEVEVLGRNGNGGWIKIRYIASDSAIAREAWISQPLIQITRLGEDVSIMSLPERE